MTCALSSREFVLKRGRKCTKPVAFGPEKREEPGEMRGGQIALGLPLARMGQRKDL